MKRDDLRKLEISEEAIDKIMDWNMADIGKEKAKTDAAKADLTEAKSKLTSMQEELDTLNESGGDLAKVQKQLAELQEKYSKETADLKEQLASRDYDDAITRAINRIDGEKLNSKSAERAFTASLKEKKLELKDGELVGFDDFLKAYKEDDPDAFSSTKPAPRFATGSGGAGGHGTPTQPISRAATLAAQYHQNQYGTPKE